MQYSNEFLMNRLCIYIHKSRIKIGMSSVGEPNVREGVHPWLYAGEVERAAPAVTDVSWTLSTQEAGG